MSSFQNQAIFGRPCVEFVWPKSIDTLMVIICLWILFAIFMSLTGKPVDPAKVQVIPLFSVFIMTAGLLLYFFRSELKKNVEISNKILNYLFNQKVVMTIEEIAQGINYHELNKLAARLEELIGKGYIKEGREITYALAKK